MLMSTIISHSQIPPSLTHQPLLIYPTLLTQEMLQQNLQIHKYSPVGQHKSYFQGQGLFCWKYHVSQLPSAKLRDVNFNASGNCSCHQMTQEQVGL